MEDGSSSPYSPPLGYSSARYYARSNSLREVMNSPTAIGNTGALMTTLSPGGRKNRFDVSGTMDRLRSSLVGDSSSHGVSNNNNPLPLEAIRSEGNTSIDADNNATTTNGDYVYEKHHHQPPKDDPSCVEILPPLEEQSPKFSHAIGPIGRICSKIPAIILIGMFHLMIGIPFGVSYFPIGWSSSSSHLQDSSDTSAVDDDSVHGPFPLPGKEALGIRMFLFSTVIGQMVFTISSGFVNPIGLQMVENVPFCHALSYIVLEHQGYGKEALATLFVMFGLSSIIVGAVFYVLGRLELGRVVYYFPTHVLVGCIGGIGIFLAKTSIEVTIDSIFGWNSISKHWELLFPVFVFEVLLRILERLNLQADGKPAFSLLSPVYFCLITPVFYVVLWVLGVDMNYANQAGFFFPSLLDDCEGTACSPSMLATIFNEDLLDMWKVIDFSVVSWRAIFDSIPTLVALTLFSLIHVPINIPAFAISTNTEADMNRELVAHGYSNLIAGFFGGLQNYMAYTQSVLYDKSGGRGMSSGFAVAILTSLLFFVGPTIASYIPRCMAGTLLLHVGIDLFLEGVYDSYGKFDHLEYAGIWLIAIVMTVYGMDAAMIAGGIAAVSTHAVQSVHYVNPVRGSMSASTLRSSRWNRPSRALDVLNDESIGRNLILVIQLQGHLFFGNTSRLMQSINSLFKARSRTDSTPCIVILDFSLVLGIDSSAAQTMAKLKNVLHKSYNVDLCIFVTGSVEGFPCEFDLSAELRASNQPSNSSNGHDIEADPISERTALMQKNTGNYDSKFVGSYVKDTLDLALIFAEDALLARQGVSFSDDTFGRSSSTDEQDVALQYLKNLCPGDVDSELLQTLFSKFERKVYRKDDVLWTQGSPGDSCKLLVQGQLISLLEHEAGTSETVVTGNTVGELGLVQGEARMSSLVCLSDEAIVYSLSRQSYELLLNTSPHAARLIDLMCIRYLSARVQHVSNRIFETRCLPI